MKILSLLLAMAAADYREAARLLEQGKLEEASRRIEEALALRPDEVPALLVKGRLSVALSRLDEAREAFRKAVALAPESAEAQFLLGFFYYVDNDFTLAIAPLERARKIQPRNSRAVFFLALTHDGLGQTDRALALFEETIGLQKAKPEAEPLLACARLLFRLGRMDDAMGRVELALAVEPGSREAHYEKARILLERGQAAESARWAGKAFLLPGAGVTDRQLHFVLARAYGKLNQPERAAEHRRKFEAEPPRVVR